MIKNYKNLTGAFILILLYCCFQQKVKAQTVQTFSYTGSLQTFTVPPCVSIMTIEARGAGGGSVNVNCSAAGGLGARMIGTFTCTPGQLFTILVGQAGISNNSDAGGGGGSFVVISGTVPLIVAGGGGGASNNVGSCGNNLNGLHASITTSGTASANNAVQGGVNGNGGGASTGAGGGGGGFYADGAAGSGGNPNGNGKSYLNGAAGGTGNNNNHGGYGGGGCGWYTGGNGGGGGGYSGGGTSGNSPYSGGGGGGSYNSGTNQVNTAGVQSGNGLVTFSYFPGLQITYTMTPPVGICTGGTATLAAVSGMTSYTWSTNANTQSIVVSPPSTTSYTVQGTNPQGCISTGVITVTVSSSIPVLSVVSSTNQTCLGKTVTLTASGAISYNWSGGVTNGVSFAPSVTSSYTVSGSNGCGTSTAVTTVSIAPLQVSAITAPTITCAGQSATLTAISPANGYTWQPFGLIGSTVVVNPTVTTIYTVTVSDGTCAGVTDLTLTVKPIPTITVVSSASVICPGDAVYMTASGGSNYNWTPGNLSGPSVTVFPTGPTLYSVSGSNSVGCSAGTTQIVLLSPGPTVNITASSTLVCSGDLVNLLASGANSYTWSNGVNTAANAINPTITTVYSVTGFSQNSICPDTKTISVSVFEPALSVTPTSTTVCSGASLSLMASGADSYLWNTGSTGQQINVNPLTNTVYVVTATSSSITVACSISNSVMVSVYPNPTVTATSSRTVICRNEKTTLTAGGALSYSWNSGATTSAITVSSSVVTTLNYTVTGTDNNGCHKDATIQVKINSCTNVIEQSQSRNQLAVYPNPSTGEFFLEYDAEIDIRITNTVGQEIKIVRLTEASDFKISVKELPAGIYFISGKRNSGNVFGKIVVEK